MLAYFDIPQFLYSHRNCNGAMVGFNAQNAGAMNKVARPVSPSCLRPVPLLTSPSLSPPHSGSNAQEYGNALPRRVQVATIIVKIRLRSLAL